MKRSKTKKSKNYLVKILISFAVIVASALITAGALHLGTVTQSTGSCQRGPSLKICLTIDKTAVAASERLNLVTTVENISGEIYEASFSCDDTSPSVIRNGEVMMVGDGMCALVMTSVDMPVGEKKIYKTPLEAYQLGAGEHSIRTSWQSESSGEVLVDVADDSERPLTEQEQACLRGVDSSVCANVTIGVSDEQFASYDGMTCEDFDELLSSLELTHSQTLSNTCDLGLALYHVPKSRYSYYHSEIERIEKTNL